MDIGANKTPIKVTKKGEFGCTYLKIVYSSVNKKWFKKSWKEFDQLKKKLIKSIIIQIITMLVLINMVLNVKQR